MLKSADRSGRHMRSELGQQGSQCCMGDCKRSRRNLGRIVAEVNKRGDFGWCMAYSVM